MLKSAAERPQLSTWLFAKRFRLVVGLMLVLLSPAPLAVPEIPAFRTFKITDASLKALYSLGLPESTISNLSHLKGLRVTGEDEFLSIVSAAAATEPLPEVQRLLILGAARYTPHVLFTYGVSAALFLMGFVFIASHLRYERAKRVALEIQKLKREQLDKLKEGDFAHLDEAMRLREEKYEADFLKNLESSFVLQRLRLKQLSFFADSEWVFQPGVNILLGRNGYGKSLLLNALAAMLTKEEGQSDSLLSKGGSLELQLVRNAEELTVVRQQLRFVESIGKVPILAIPDTRFVDRTEGTVGPSEDSFADLREFGAYHFLHDVSYSGIIRALLGEICLDYWENHQSFDLPVFAFIQRVFDLLTDQRFRFHSIERAGRTSFKIQVLSEGAETPILIQRASQGTLAILAIFGLIRSYLKALHPDTTDEDRRNEQPAIVIIDEIDAHLHPSWQQRLTGALRTMFPRIQFIVSAHSPLIVAGSLEREVVVLRKGPRGFRIDQENAEFVGASSQRLYEEVFDIEDADDSLRLHPSWKPIEPKDLERIRQLEDIEDRALTADEQLSLASLKRESRVRRLAEDARNERGDERTKVLELEAEIVRLRERIKGLEGDVPEARE